MLDFYPIGQELAEASPNQNQRPCNHGDIQQPSVEPPFEQDLTQVTQTTQLSQASPRSPPCQELTQIPKDTGDNVIT